jgi:hypothetical protein
MQGKAPGSYTHGDSRTVRRLQNLHLEVIIGLCTWERLVSFNCTYVLDVSGLAYIAGREAVAR